MTTHTAEKAIDVAFQTIVSFIALQPIEYTGLDGSIQQADPSTPIGDLIVKLGAQLVLNPTPLVAVLDDASDTQVEVPYTAAVGDIVVLNEDGSVPVDPVAGTNFFTEEEWNKLIVPGTEVDTPTEPVAVPVATTDSTPSQAPTVDIPTVDPTVVTPTPVADVVTDPSVQQTTTVTPTVPGVDAVTQPDATAPTPVVDPAATVSTNDVPVQAPVPQPADSIVQVSTTDATPAVTVDPTVQPVQ